MRLAQPAPCRLTCPAVTVSGAEARLPSREVTL